MLLYHGHVTATLRTNFKKSLEWTLASICKYCCWCQNVLIYSRQKNLSSSIARLHRSPNFFGSNQLEKMWMKYFKTKSKWQSLHLCLFSNVFLTIFYENFTQFWYFSPDIIALCTNHVVQTNLPKTHILMTPVKSFGMVQL